jgi:AraC-like DNA-binding protein
VSSSITVVDVGSWCRISKEVGYASVSHFISEFRGRFGVTPRAYCDMNAMHAELGSQRLPQGGTRA